MSDWTWSVFLDSKLVATQNSLITKTHSKLTHSKIDLRSYVFLLNLYNTLWPAPDNDPTLLSKEEY